jgi:hypothetical protein
MLVETLPMLTRDEKKPEDGQKWEGDDALDATRYLLYSRLHARQAPQEERFQERIAAAEFTEPHSMAIWMSKWKHREQTGPIRFGRHSISRRRRT